MENQQRTQLTASSYSPVTVRFFFVRHGETVANNQALVVGQWDSPLSKVGKRQAAALGRSSMMKSTGFWRKYCSDLGRAKETSRLMFPQNEEDFILDKRIREIAKGARQEHPKSWDYERAVQERQRAGKDIPVLETSDDAWRRIADFIAAVLEEAQDSCYDATADKKDDRTVDLLTVNVLVVSHAGALRTLFQKMASKTHPSLEFQDDPSRPSDDTKRLQIPNTSVTILDVTPTAKFQGIMDERANRQRIGLDREDAVVDSDKETITGRLSMLDRTYQELWDTKVVEFLWTGHLDATLSTNNDE
ncbi:phosphoglyceromutase [Nitzschia inconspicua]|uniref:Phosphoglyceromutase n=1 Tax=Nitzschia inconspicua TaxID=303405 RepID=A0A9K3KU08_9STRA|nr:phosphoglyceromutase [Nitzschia inconspicua]